MTESKENLPELKKEIEQLLSGKKKAGNQYVEYAVTQMKKCQEEYEVVRRNLQNLDNQLRNQQARVLEINAEFNKYTDDIEYWMNPPEDTKKKTKKGKAK